MKERPILMCGAMVCATIEGRKTNTRRVMKPQPVDKGNGWFDWGYVYGGSKSSLPRSAFWHHPTWLKEIGTAPLEVYCPYGQPGDLLWVREVWAYTDSLKRAVAYRADGDKVLDWKPSIHMRREHSRLTLEITEVRMQQVQDISEEDAFAEGVTFVQQETAPNSGKFEPCARREFAHLWDSINAKRGYSWAANPWVWALSFRVLKGGA